MSKRKYQIETIEKERNTKLYRTDEAIEHFKVTRYFLNNVSKSKIKEINYHCYEQRLYDGNIIKNELKIGENKNDAN